MSVRPYRDIHRRKSRRVMVGSVPVGDGAPILSDAKARLATLVGTFA